MPRQNATSTRLTLLDLQVRRALAALEATLLDASRLDYDSARFAAALGHLAQARDHLRAAEPELHQAAIVARAATR